MSLNDVRKYLHINICLRIQLGLRISSGILTERFVTRIETRSKIWHNISF